MSIKQHVRPPEGRYDKVEAAYDGLDEADKEVMKGLLLDPDYPHAQVARVLRAIGYDIDRKQVCEFRLKIKMGRVKL